MKNINIFLKVLLLFVLATGVAQAQASRTWVSGVGDDANPCSRTAPCKTFAGAISKTAAGGEIDALDPGGFGLFTITKAITIDGGGAGVTSILVSGTNAIVVAAGPTDVVTIRNMSINGIGSGINGIRFTSGKALHVENCTISGFTDTGIDIATSAGGQVFVLGTVSRDNTQNGIRAIATVTNVLVTIEKSHFENNGTGVLAGDFSRFTVRDSNASGNGAAGFTAQASAGDVVMNISNSIAGNNVGPGIQAGGSTNLSKIRLTGVSLLSNNVAGGVGMSVQSNGQVVSYGNNYNSGTGAPTSTASPQ